MIRARLFLPLLFATACGPSDTEQRQQAVQRYAEVASSMYGQTLTRTKAMQTAIAAFVASPTDASLTAAKEAWKAARVPYELTEGLRFAGGPIDNGEAGQPEANINPWPLDESTIDAVEGDPGAGLINDDSQPLTEASLRAANGAAGETNLTIGWHAIEFLLWGQDLSATGPGARPVTDYTTEAHAERRKQYLTLVTGILVEDLEGVTAQWKLDDPASYGAAFVAAAKPDDSLTRAIKGLGNFVSGELTAQRMNIAYATKDQEEEHSCFSDTTVPIDLPTSLLGVQQLMTGTLDGSAGPGIQSLVAAKDEALGQRLDADLQAALTAMNAIPAPFDQAILGADSSPGRTAILASMKANKKFALTLADAAAALGLSLDFDYCPEGVTSCKPE